MLIIIYLIMITIVLSMTIIYLTLTTRKSEHVTQGNIFRKHKNTAGKVETHMNMKIHEKKYIRRVKMRLHAGCVTSFARQIHKHNLKHTNYSYQIYIEEVYTAKYTRILD